MQIIHKGKNNTWIKRSADYGRSWEINDRQVPTQQTGARVESPWAAIRTGTIVGLTNPKSLVLFTAVVPQFINPAAGSASMQILLLGFAPMLIGLITDTVWALTAGRARTWLAQSPRRMTAIERVGGLSVIGVGVSVAVSGNRN